MYPWDDQRWEKRWTEDHPDVRVVPCTHCGSEGRLYRGHANDPNPRDCGPCPVCEGTGGEVIEVEPVELENLEAERAAEERRQLENAEMAEHFRKHPHG